MQNVPSRRQHITRVSTQSPICVTMSLFCTPSAGDTFHHNFLQKVSHCYLFIFALNRTNSFVVVSVKWSILASPVPCTVIEYSAGWVNSFSRLLTHYNWFIWPNFPNHSYSSGNKDTILKTLDTFHLFAHIFQFAQCFLQNSTQKQHNFAQV